MEGRLAPGAGPLDALAALHPAGSVTGAPKRAALAAIAALERTPRGAYCGALGHGRGARFAASVLIRTAERVRDGWTYGVGGGIVIDSDAAAELAEARQKLEALCAYTTLLVTDAGVVLYEAHARRLAPDGGAARARGSTASRRRRRPARTRSSTTARGSTSGRAPAPRCATACRPASSRRRSRGAAGAIPKPPPPGPYAALRAPGVATLLASPDGAELWEACVAAVVSWDGARLVLVPEDRPRVASVAEAAVRAGFPHAVGADRGRRRRAAPARERAEGTCTVAAPGRAPFPERVRAELDGLIAATARRP